MVRHQFSLPYSVYLIPFPAFEGLGFFNSGEVNTDTTSDAVLKMQLACLTVQAARYEADIQAHLMVRDSIDRNIHRVRSTLNHRAAQRHEEEISAYLSDTVPPPPKRTPKEVKEPKEPKEKKPKSSKGEGSSAQAPPSTTEGSSKSKGKATVTKPKTRAAREAGEVKEKTKTAPAPAAGGSKGKGKTRAPPKSKEIVEEEEEDQVSLGGEDVEMDEVDAAPVAEGTEMVDVEVADSSESQSSD